MATYNLEVIGRGIFQGTLATRICRSVVLAARKQGRTGIAFGRYSDSPERNGIPAKQFAIIADDAIELEGSMVKYYPPEVDATVVLDDTLLKGIESWAWDGLVPVNKRVKERGVLLVVTNQTQEELLEDVHVKDLAYKLVVTPGEASFSGMWVFKDDHTEARVLGALAQACPDLVNLEKVKEVLKDKAKQDSATKAAKGIVTRVVEPGEGNPEEPYTFELPVWEDLADGLVVKCQPVGTGYRGGKEGFQPVRNPVFKKYLTRTLRPITNFEKCTQCTLCWLNCPEGAYDVTPDGYYECDYYACCGCGKCEEACEAGDHLFMIPEWEFTDNASAYEMWKKDPDAYQRWFEEKIAKRVPRSHGYHHKGQYEEEIARKGVS